MVSNTTTPLSRALVKQRKALQLSEQQVATGINRTLDKVQRYETGQIRPTPQVLALLDDVLQFDFSSTFPLPGTSDKELKQAANVKGRLHHLIGLVAAGVQWRFAAGTGLPKTAVSNAINGRQPLTSAHLDTVCRALPDLSREWVLTGKGVPFAEGRQIPQLEVPNYPPGRALSAMSQYEEHENLPSYLPVASKSSNSKSRKTAKERIPAKHPNGVGPVFQEVLEVNVFDQCSMTGNFTLDEAEELPFSSLNKMVTTLRTFAGHDCGLTSAQVAEVATYLNKIVRKYSV